MNMTCCEGDCCDPTECESCISGTCEVCEGTGVTCCDGDCCEYTNETCCDDNCCAPTASNGCGPRDDENPESHDDPANCSGQGEDSSFKDACDAHDICWGECSADPEQHKSACDDAFDEDMDAACDRPGNGPICANLCGIQRVLYNIAVWIGQSYYDDAQECDCCLNP